MSEEPATENSLLKTLLLLKAHLPRDGRKAEESAKFIEALAQIAKAYEDDKDMIPFWSQKAEIRLDDLNDAALARVKGLKVEETPLNALIDTIAQGKAPDNDALETWLKTKAAGRSAA